LNSDFTLKRPTRSNANVKNSQVHALKAIDTTRIIRKTPPNTYISMRAKMTCLFNNHVLTW